MAENADGQEKSEQATPKRLEQARDRGQVAKSVDTTTAALLLLGILVVYLFSGRLVDQLRAFSQALFVNSGFIQINDSTTPEYFMQLAFFIAFTILPVLVIIYAVALGAEIMQVGVHFASKKFTEGVDFKRVFNPFTGIKNTFFSSRTVVEFVKGLFKILIIGTVVYSVLAPRASSIMVIMTMPFVELGPFMTELAFELVYKVGLAYIIIALADFFYQKWKFRKDMMMTKQETRDENKQMEGDVRMKARIRQMGRNRLQRLMLQRVKDADVVITNPTHYAVALKYDIETMDAPRVLAKGADFLALQIRKIATENNVPIVEEKALARSLYAMVDIDQVIPESLFTAVAQILATVYRARQDAAQQS